MNERAVHNSGPAEDEDEEGDDARALGGAADGDDGGNACEGALVQGEEEHGETARRLDVDVDEAAVYE